MKMTKTLSVTVPLKIMITVSMSIFRPLDDPDTKVLSILAIFRGKFFAIVCKKNMITSVCFIYYFNMLLATCYSVWIPAFMERQLRDLVEKTKGLVFRFTTSHARIAGI